MANIDRIVKAGEAKGDDEAFAEELKRLKDIADKDTRGDNLLARPEARLDDEEDDDGGDDDESGGTKDKKAKSGKKKK